MKKGYYTSALKFLVLSFLIYLEVQTIVAQEVKSRFYVKTDHGELVNVGLVPESVYDTCKTCWADQYYRGPKIDKWVVVLLNKNIEYLFKRPDNSKYRSDGRLEMSLC